MLTKKSVLYLFFFMYILFATGFSSPLEIGNDGFGNPFLIYDNPALIVRQHGAPTGCSFYYNSSLKKYSFIAGIIESFKKSAFAIAYNKNTQEGFNTFSTAFSTAYKQISFGSSFHFLFSKKEPEFTLDAGFSYHFKEKRYAGLVVKNIINVDTSNELLARELNITTGGNIPRLKRMFYTVQGLGILYNLKNRDYGYGGIVNIHKFFFTNPSLSLYSMGRVVYKHTGELEWLVEVMAGYHHLFNRFALGIYTGYEYLSQSEKSRISCSMYCNPLYRRKLGDFNCSIELDSPKMTPDGDRIHDNVIITIKGIFYKEDVKVKRWTLLITDTKDPEGTIIRTFSGGNIPPSSIQWDGRDTKGNVVKNGTYYLKLIIIDSINRVISSSFKEVTVY